MNEDPFACMRSGKIRNDLFFRPSTVILEVPRSASAGTISPAG